MTTRADSRSCRRWDSPRRRSAVPIRSQILLMFFLPLAAAAVHISAAFPIITRLLAAMTLTNVSLFAATTAGTLAVFAAVYAAVYVLTSRVYFKIVS